MNGKLLGGKYEVLERIREGGMGAIYRARHIHLGTICVVKLMHAHLQEDRSSRERFRREAQTALRIHHPNVVRFFDYAMEEDGTALLVMEHIDGVDVAEFQREVAHPTLAVTLAIAHQGLEALACLHGMGFIHRDISPENLMLTKDSSEHLLVKLIDLGLAKAKEEYGLTATGMFVGKLKYGSPEQLGPRRKEGLDGRTDLYSFGVMLYQLLTGVAPFESDSPGGWVYAHLVEPPRSFDEVDPMGFVPDSVRAAVMRALAKDRAERFRTAEEFIGALEPARLAAGNEGLAEAVVVLGELVSRNTSLPDAPPTALLALTPATAPRSSRMPLVAAGAAAILLAVGLWLLRGTLSAPTPVAAPSTGRAAPARHEEGFLSLSSTPWATLTELISKDTGLPMSVAEKRTPLRLALPAGNYHLRLTSTESSRATELDVAIAARRVTTEHVAFEGFDVERLIDTYAP